MAKQYNYKGKIIKNSPYGSEARWFITNEDGSKNNRFNYPERTLKEAKQSINDVEKSLEHNMDFYIECPHCHHKHEDWQNYVETGDMDGEFPMICDECEKEFKVKFTTTINFKTEI